MQRVITKFCKIIWLSLMNGTLSLFNKIMSKDFSKHTKSNLEINCKQMFAFSNLSLD